MIDQGAIGMLAMDLGHLAGDLAQQIEADRLVIDEGPARAVRHLDAADDQFRIGVDPLLFEDGEGRMAGRRVEGGGDDALVGARAHQLAIAARAERKPEGIEQDRFARARLAGEHGHAVLESDVEFFDEDDVANRKRGQHGAVIAERTRAGDAPGLVRAQNGLIDEKPG